MIAFSFSVEGRPRSQPRPRFVPGRRRPISTTGPAIAWRSAIVRAAKAAIVNTGWTPIPGAAFRLSMRFRFKTDDVELHGALHTHKPDADNLAKLVMDALKVAGAYRDDSQVAQPEPVKVWWRDSGVDVAMSGVSRRLVKPATVGCVAPGWLVRIPDPS